MPVARPWRDDLHTERVGCVIASGRWPQRNEEFLVSVGVVQPGAVEVPVPPSPGPRRREGPVTGYAVIAIKAEAASDDCPVWAMTRRANRGPSARGICAGQASARYR